MKTADEVISKIQKLLALANSDNENEARLASERANELLLKHNLSLQQVHAKDSDYVETTIQIRRLEFTYGIIGALLREYFFVKVIRSKSWNGRTQSGRARWKSSLSFYGRRENVECAQYVFEYLSQVLPRLWSDFQAAHPGRGQRKSYQLGIVDGIEANLEATRFRVQQETGLVLVKDPKVEGYCSTAKSCRADFGEFDPHSYVKGHDDGKNVKLRKPITTDRKEGGLLYLNPALAASQSKEGGGV